MNRLLWVVVPLALFGSAGCSDGTTDVTGKVTYKGSAVVYGTVVVLDSGGSPRSGAIQPDGTFRIKGVKIGAAKVAVTSLAPPGAKSAQKSRDTRDGRDDEKPPPPDAALVAPEVIKSWVALPDKYGDPNKSELTADVKAGQPLDFDLK